MKKTINRILKIVLIVFVVTALTAITQIGGIVFLLSLLTSKLIRIKFTGKRLVVFLILYIGCTLFIVPYLAPIWGRERIHNTESIKPVNFAYTLLNRNYVTPEVNNLLQSASDYLQSNNSSITIRYLDACFPFIDGFPLLPHLSHKDGKKIDLALVYETSEGEITDKSRSVSGYGVFEGPQEREYNQPEACLKQGNTLYEYPRYLTFGTINSGLKFSEKGTGILIESLLKHKGVQTIFIEPHLKKRLRLHDQRIGFQGCHSVRHDDHIHVQVR